MQALDGVYVYEGLAINYNYGVEPIETSPTIAMDMVETLFATPAAAGTPVCHHGRWIRNEWNVGEVARGR